MMTPVHSWGRYQSSSSHLVDLQWPSDPFPQSHGGETLAMGCGRSYGDVCQLNNGHLLQTRNLNRFIALSETGELSCEAGVTFDEILRLVVPRGWFLPVTPGTKWVTVGGAICNDIHGKNHHVRGTFGCHVKELELLRSDQERLICSFSSNSDLYRATIGGLGLTGLITKATLQLIPASTAFIDAQTLKFKSADEFFELADDSDGAFEYTVAWVDTLSSGENYLRGHFIRGNHSESGDRSLHSTKTIKVPVWPPFNVLRVPALRTFNAIYYRRQFVKQKSRLTHYEPFFYPLDKVANWNRLYGPSGFLQYQFVLPESLGRPKTIAFLKELSSMKIASFLSVLKRFGSQASPGFMSFPTAGLTASLDFPFRGPATLEQLTQLDNRILEMGGRVYPAKDARMSSRAFQAFFPHWQKLEQYRDPHITSDLWKRTTGKT